MTESFDFKNCFYCKRETKCPICLIKKDCIAIHVLWDHPLICFVCGRKKAKEEFLHSDCETFFKKQPECPSLNCFSPASTPEQ